MSVYATDPDLIARTWADNDSILAHEPNPECALILARGFIALRERVRVLEAVRFDADALHRAVANHAGDERSQARWNQLSVSLSSCLAQPDAADVMLTVEKLRDAVARLTAERDAAKDDLIVELRSHNSALRALDEIRDLASWHYDPEANEDDLSPADMVAHVNGLIVRKCNDATRRGAGERGVE